MSRRVHQNQRRVVYMKPKPRSAEAPSVAVCEAHYWPAAEFLARMRRAAAHRRTLKLAPIVLCPACRARFETLSLSRQDPPR